MDGSDTLDAGDLTEELTDMAQRACVRWLPLLLISSVSLFLEMAVIRWIAAEIRLFSYFKNLSLLAAFLGLAIGFGLVGRRRDLLRSTAPLLLIFVVMAFGVGHFVSPGPLPYPGTSDESLWSSGSVWYVFDLLFFLSIVLIFFLMIVFLFIPFGQATGKEMARHEPVPAYVVNLLGSLVGIWLFALLSYLQTPPAVWFGLGMLGSGIYLAGRRMLSRSTLAIFGLVLVGLVLVDRGITWSPYHRLEVAEVTVPYQGEKEHVKVGHYLTVQQVYYQTALDLSSNLLAEIQDGTSANDLVEIMVDAAFSYDLPYALVPEKAEVLIVGAGMGNDVAAALRNGVSHIDAVEIDPAILELGHELHPESPYEDARVTAVVDDARSFLEKNRKSYDVIVFGLLDSHTLLSGMSNVRLDSFVYTLDSFVQVRDHLVEDGFVSLTFAVGAPWIEQRLGLMLEQVFGAGRVYVHKGTIGTTFLAGSISPELLAEHRLSTWQPDPSAGEPPLATDDWPFLYLRARKVPTVYWQALLIIGLACLAIIARSFPEALRPDWHFWFLGAAFLLIEFKTVTELALLFGTTWMVNVLAVSGVLLMALGANLVVLLRRSPLNLRAVYVLLFASLGMNYFFPLDLLLGFSPAVRGVGGMLLLSLPLFFSGLVFSESLRRAREAARPMASNLSGSVAGGVLEYGALMWGIKSLYIIAALLYAGSLVAFLKGRK